MGLNQSNQNNDHDPISCKFEGVGFEGEKEITYVAVPPHIYMPCRLRYPLKQKPTEYYRCIYDAYKWNSGELLGSDEKGNIDRQEQMRWITFMKRKDYESRKLVPSWYDLNKTGFMRKRQAYPINVVDIKDFKNLKPENYWHDQFLRRIGSSFSHLEHIAFYEAYD